MNKISKIFVIHYKPLNDRRSYIENYFKNNNIINYEFREKYQREDLTEELKNVYFKLNNLSPAQICITVEHIETMKHL